MDIINKEEYVARISTASPVELTVINYDILLDYLKLSKSNLQKDNKVAFKKNMDVAKNAIMSLMESLNMKYDLANELLDIYLFCNKKILTSQIVYSETYIDEVIKVLENLRKSWVQISENNEEPAIMQNVQKVVAGMTYSNGQLSEYVDQDENRGFKV